MAKTGRSQAASDATSERPAKRVKILSDYSSSDDSDAEGTTNGVSPDGFKVNEDYAKRFEHNKKRAEKHRLEEKYGKSGQGDESGSGPGSSSDSESEDDEGLLATTDLDAEISATLNAIKSRDPRVYDKNSRFYSEFDADAADAAQEVQATRREKPMYLQDYHRKNLLEGGSDIAEDHTPPQTYAQEQEALKNSIVKEMHAAAGDEAASDGSGSKSEDFMVPSKKPANNGVSAGSRTKAKVKTAPIDVAEADKDPETYLSNFMESRAWVPGDFSHFKPLESDDSEEEARAEAFEDAYNMRFEDPEGSREKLKLMSYARDAAAEYSVRREEATGRRKTRDKERAKRDAEKAEREEGKARLRRLKIEEVEEKVKRIKEAAGLRGKALAIEDWSKVLEEDWDDDRWDKEMKRRFDETYYAEDEAADESDEATPANGQGKRKVKKPKWDDDIEIKDLVPDFADEDEDAKPAFTLSDEDEAVDNGGNNEDDNDVDVENSPPTAGKPTTKKSRLLARADQKKAARKERQKIEELVDSSLPLAIPALPSSSTNKASTIRFRYRETSPSTFGLTPHDILMADDSQLNQYAGLKKMAAFRDPEKKRKDKKKLGKKARLRQWRKETFGNEEGPRMDYGRSLGLDNGGEGAASGREQTKKKRKGRRKAHAKADAAE
ncbi:Kinetochore protein Spc24 [Cryomyces antarcticus]|uniref:Kinetochore protein Spc24 n=1 Tax=Cryomyces antarcticus TaxID=329879 RepID=A0ABR0LP73_9PEZI|nr:Kinetochore protein Spc24 [Cryomyces antarcticus]